MRHANQWRGALLLCALMRATQAGEHATALTLSHDLGGEEMHELGVTLRRLEAMGLVVRTKIERGQLLQKRHGAFLFSLSTPARLALGLPMKASPCVAIS